MAHVTDINSLRILGEYFFPTASGKWLSQDPDVIDCHQQLHIRIRVLVLVMSESNRGSVPHESTNLKS